MRMLFLPASSSRTEQSCLQSDRDGKTTRSSLVGTVLARRYKILERIGLDGFKAHDLALDQTVRVRQASLISQRVGDTWRQKVQQLALVRDPRLLNVLNVISDKSSDLVITERPRGHSLADLLRERSRLDPEDVLRLLTPLAGALDLAAAYSCCPNAISTCWLFTEAKSSCAMDPEQKSLSDWPSFLVKLDVWELVRPRKNNNWPFPTSKALRDGSRGLAVRQAALLTFELLGGKRRTEGKVKRWFKPVDGLGEAGNSILNLGLQGSPRFRRCECFFQKLKSAYQLSKQESSALPAPALVAQKNPVFLPGTDDVIRKFNRETRFVATGVLGAVVFAGLMLAFMVQEHYPNAVVSAEEAVQAGGNLLLNNNLSALGKNVALTRKSSSGEIALGQARTVDQAPPKISSQENPSSQIEAATSTPTPVVAFTPEINHHDLQTNASYWVPAHSLPRGRSRSSVRTRFVDVKMRLIALWHQSLMRSERTRSWALSSNLKKANRKTVSYTTQTSH
jgi:hypothetical protein